MKLTEGYRKSGIYRITNPLSGKSYIGSSKNIGKRISEHYCKLVSNKHPNIHLQRAWNKYGDIFTAELVELCDNALLEQREQFHIDKSGYYNLLRTAYSVKGRKQSKEEIEKRVSKLRGRKFPPSFGANIRKRMLGKTASTEAKQNMSKAHLGTVNIKTQKPILQFTNQGVLIKEWGSLKEVVNTLDIKYSTLSMCLHGKNKTCSGFSWKFKLEKNGQVQ